MAQFLDIDMHLYIDYLSLQQSSKIRIFTPDKNSNGTLVSLKRFCFQLSGNVVRHVACPGMTRNENTPWHESSDGPKN